MNDQPAPNTDSQEQNRQLPASDGNKSAVLTGWNALGWSAVVAILAAFATCAGLLRSAGRSNALALYSLSHPTLDQRDTFRGMSTILVLLFVTLIPFLIAYFLYRFATWGFRKTTVVDWVRLRFTKHSRLLAWVALVVMLTDVGFLNTSMATLQKQSEGIVLKDASQAGTVWTDILLDEDLETEAGYSLAFGSGMALFIGVSWWLITTKAKRRFSRIAFSLWAGTQALFLAFGFCYLTGVADTIGELPIVAFSGSGELVPQSLPVLLGSDDKQFALLIINAQPKPGERAKYILYLPRTEVRWMTVLKMEQLQPLARLEDLKKLSQ